LYSFYGKFPSLFRKKKRAILLFFVETLGFAQTHLLFEKSKIKNFCKLHSSVYYQIAPFYVTEGLGKQRVSLIKSAGWALPTKSNREFQDQLVPGTHLFFH